MDAAIAKDSQDVSVHLSDKDFSYYKYMMSAQSSAFAANPLHWPEKLAALEEVLLLETKVRNGDDKTTIFSSEGDSYFFDKQTLLNLQGMTEELFATFKAVGILAEFKKEGTQTSEGMANFYAVQDLGKVLYSHMRNSPNAILDPQTLILPIIVQPEEAVVPTITQRPEKIITPEKIEVKLSNPKSTLLDFTLVEEFCCKMANPLTEKRNLDLLEAILKIETDFRRGLIDKKSGPIKLDGEEVYIPVEQIIAMCKGIDKSLLNIFLQAGILEPLSEKRRYEVESLAVTDLGKLLWYQFNNNPPEINAKYVFLPEVKGAVQL